MAEFTPVNIVQIGYGYWGTNVARNIMQSRKTNMIALSDAFVAVPGGIGTMDELFSILAMKASHRLDKDILIYNVNGFFDGLLDCLKAMEQGGFLYSELKELYRVEEVRSEA